MAQWLRICLAMQRTLVRSPVQEDPTRHGATKPVGHNYQVCTLEPVSYNYGSPCTWSLCSREATAMRSLCAAVKSSPNLLQPEKAHVQQRRPSTAKNKIK